ncbi:MAG: nitrite reductase, copper-containing [Methylococcales bacterium]|nr:nitrite reductase, copper-containing [Methylococcales bacterium]
MYHEIYIICDLYNINHDKKGGVQDLLIQFSTYYEDNAMKKLFFLIITLFFLGCSPHHAKKNMPLNINLLERVTQKLVAPPYLPAHNQIAVGQPKIVQIRLVVEEKEIEVSEGVFIHANTFNGSVPAPLVVVHQDDYVEVTLVNPKTNSHMHNVDFHAATGALGGGTITKVKPGEEVTIRFKAIKAGVFVYHCAPGGIMIPFHVVTGMNGAIMVLPREGLKDNKGNPVHYDKAFYIGEQDYYLPKDKAGKYKKYSSLTDSMGDMLAKMQTLIPSHIVFNGKMNALTGDNALTANVGENILFIHSQANRDSRPHLIGGHGELVWEGGSFSDAPVTNRETWFIPGGSAVAALYKFKQSGTYVYLNHNLIEAVQFGAMAHVKVKGAWNDDLQTQITPPHPIKND